MKKSILILLICLSAIGLFAQKRSNVYIPLRSGNFVQDKNFYLFTLFQKKTAFKITLEKDTVINRIWQLKKNTIKNFVECKDNLNCLGSKFEWTNIEIDEIGIELQKLAKSNAAISHLINADLRKSGYYQIYNSLNDGELIDKAWKESAAGVNHIIDVYAKGQKPLYPDIDSTSYDIRSKTYKRLITIVADVNTTHLESDKFFEPSLNFALSLLEANNRDEAGRFEPMNEHENRAAIQNAKTIDWKKYPYTAIIVPGAGNDLPNVRMAAWGKMRVKIAAERYFKGMAPFIIVSGGFVHPFQTPFCEAYEMKQYLIQKFRVPEKAIIIDPHARHTTTNIRNANRLIFAYGISTEKKALIVTDQTQSQTISDPKFTVRCLKEMKCIPYKNLNRISPYDLEYFPDISSLYHYNVDPLDP